MHPDEDASSRRRAWVVRRVAVVTLLVAAAVLAGGWRSGWFADGGIDRIGGGDGDDSVIASSDGPAFSSLEDLVASSELVVIGRAAAVREGRTFSTGGSGIVSQVVRLEVGAVLAGTWSEATLDLEEEATTATGEPLIVDGLRPTEAGDEGIFFLVRTEPGGSTFVTVATSGRFLRASSATDDDRLLGATTPLAQRLATLGGRVLTDRIETGADQVGKSTDR